MSTPPIEWPPLGLPRGSIRALLTLLIVAVVVVEVIRGHAVDVLWSETLMIALAHYFTSRRFVKLPPQVMARLAAEGYLEPEASPLYLPRYTIRVILVAAFVGLAVYLYRHDRILESQALSVLGVVFAYFAGIALRFERFRVWEDLKAIAVLLVLLCTAGMYLAGQGDRVPHWWRDIALGLVLFYFGSR
jgi:hypothetical protein